MLVAEISLSKDVLIVLFFQLTEMHGCYKVGEGIPYQLMAADLMWTSPGNTIPLADTDQVPITKSL